MTTTASHTHGSIKSYVLGFALSLALTLVAYFSVVNRWFEGWSLVAVIIVLALTQFVVQVELFLHIGNEHKPKWNMMAFLFMVVTVATIVLGSLWIMNNLNYNMMSQHEMNEYMLKQSKKGF